MIISRGNFIQGRGLRLRWAKKKADKVTEHSQTTVSGIKWGFSHFIVWSLSCWMCTNTYFSLKKQLMFLQYNNSSIKSDQNGTLKLFARLQSHDFQGQGGTLPHCFHALLFCSGVAVRLCAPLSQNLKKKRCSLYSVCTILIVNSITSY